MQQTTGQQATPQKTPSPTPLPPVRGAARGPGGITGALIDAALKPVQEAARRALNGLTAEAARLATARLHDGVK